MTPPRRPHPGNRRDENARLDVLHAADDLLVEHGFKALTIEAIARRAGVAKQTIYRWWPSKVDILLDTLIEDSEKRFPVPLPDANVTAAVVRDYLRAFSRFLVDDLAGKVLLALMAEAQHDPATAASLRERYLDPRRAQERDMLSRGVETGEFTPRLDADSAMDVIAGTLLYRASTGSGIPDTLLDTLIEDVLKPAPNM
ncbi:TetR/AcrR family transcriptional regulator [Actinoplanes sp. LDG1-06]|uniref:TetR/AcrR family transcriptional regulator n=1 Tax=Paractinoplanes ovalisporus TaxID=2810368 RepID=A0ABS2A4L2_9ACTN|nr:TetR/AcrR family transcriptional regulator [Actinoplanes ovalisporus]MBM2614776.1 TetR/AcrR family transcriptional regulator [Actinoplanes ovalisporus]